MISVNTADFEKSCLYSTAYIGNSSQLQLFNPSSLQVINLQLVRLNKATFLRFKKCLLTLICVHIFQRYMFNSSFLVQVKKLIRKLCLWKLGRRIKNQRRSKNSFRENLSLRSNKNGRASTLYLVLDSDSDKKVIISEMKCIVNQ